MDRSTQLSFAEICDVYERCHEQMAQARATLMQFDGVIGVGIGPRQIDNRLDPAQICFVVYVEEKKPGAVLDAKQFIPREIAGIRTDVVQVGSRLAPIHNEFDARWLRPGSRQDVDLAS